MKLLQGETIHATIWKNLINNYKAKINEGSIYELSNFKVQEDTRYRPVNNALKVVFIFNTNVKEVEDCSDKFPDYYFEFASKDTLLARKNIVKQCLGMCIFIYLLFLIFMCIMIINKVS